MPIESALRARSDDKCELCGDVTNLAAYAIPPEPDGTAETAALLCGTCTDQIDTPANSDVHHWRCLSESMWTPVPAVQVLAWRMLSRLSNEDWARDLLDTLYLDEETQTWAAATGDGAASSEETSLHRDSNGASLSAGDTITLIKDLNVKGAGFTAKRGTAVRNISLVQDNPAHIEGRVNGQQIIILTEFVKKQN